MVALNISMEHIQVAKYVIAALVGLILLGAGWNRLKGPIRRNKMAALASQLELAFSPRLRFSAPPSAYAYSYAKDYAIHRSDHDAAEPPNKLHIEDISHESVLGAPRFFTVFNTGRICNYCTGFYRSFPVEVFDWQQSCGRNDRSGKGPRSTLIVLRLADGQLPWFIAFPSTDGGPRKITNRIQPDNSPEFNQRYRLQAPDGHPNSESRIVSMMNPDVMRLMIDSGTVSVQASGRYLIFSQDNVVLPANKIIELLDFGVAFCRLIHET